MADLRYWLWALQDNVKPSWFLAPFCVGLLLTVVDSLSCLTIGGVILTMVGINIFVVPHTLVNKDEIPQYRDHRSDYFVIGRDLEPQTWLLIICAGYLMIWKGFAVVYGFFQDWKARHEASRGNPIASSQSLWKDIESFMVRNIPRYWALQYTVAIMICVAGFWVQFGVTEVGIRVVRNIPRDSIDMHPVDISTRPDIGASDSTETYEEQSHRLPEAWLRDKPGGEYNTAFMHQTPFGDESTGHEGLSTGYGAINQRPDYLHSPPMAVTMASTSTVCMPFKFRDGTVISRQTVMVANMTVEEGEFRMRRDSEGWSRIDSGIATLIDETKSQVVIDYRVGDSGTLQIQWAKHGDWLNNEKAYLSEPVIQRMKYSVQYAVAEVTRYIEGPRRIGHPSEKLPWKCQHQYTRLPDDWHSLHQVLIKIRSRDSSLINIEKPDASLPLTKALIDSYIASPRRSILASISLLVRVTMTGWNPSGKQIHLLDEGDFPFGTETETMDELDRDKSIRYPYFKGSIWASGCKKSAAAVHLTLGILALLAAGVQITCAKHPARAEQE